MRLPYATGYSSYTGEVCGKPMDPKLNGKKVSLDPGHGWRSDPGAVGNGMKEKDITLEIARLTKAWLEPYGIQVSLTRNGDEPGLSLSAAATRVNQYQPTLAVAIHVNAGGGTGTESCYVVNKSTSSQSQRLAGYLSNEVSRQLGLVKRGDFPENAGDRCARKNKTGWNQIYIHDMNPPSALIETAFIDGPATNDVAKLRSRRNDFAKAISDAIIAYLRSY
jgi:N-acetylmuramoyl-L-alanine amidase